MRSKNRRPIGILAVLVSLVVVGTAAAQIVVDAPGSPYNALQSTPPESGDMNSTGDLMVSNDLEIGGQLFLSKIVYLNRDLSSPASGDQVFFFADDGSPANESFSWDDSEDGFRFSDDLVMAGTRRITADSEGVLRLGSEHPAMHFILDSDNDNSLATSHQFVWYNNGVASNLRVMQLQSNTSNVGDLFIDGQLAENHSFDLAESFWQSASVEPGDLVAVDPNRPDAVLPTHGAEDRAVLGVVSTRPGLLMGGFAFSVERLRDTWGDEVATTFEELRPRLEAEILASDPDLAEQRDRLSSPASFASGYLAEWQAPVMPTPGDGPVRVAPAPSAEDLYEEYESAREAYDQALFDKVMSRFFEEHFAPVALAGRVPVRVDAFFGAVEPGDLLAPSPVPGAAMKATRPGPTVGVALESLAAGEDKILVFVQRGWYGGDALATASGGLHAAATLADLRAENERLESRLVRLEQRFGAFAGERRARVVQTQLSDIGAAGARGGEELPWSSREKAGAAGSN